MGRQPACGGLEEAWTLGPDEHILLSGKREGPTRLGFAVLVRFFAREGRLPDPEEVGEDVIIPYFACQVGVLAAEYRAYKITTAVPPSTTGHSSVRCSASGRLPPGTPRS